MKMFLPLSRRLRKKPRSQKKNDHFPYHNEQGPAYRNQLQQNNGTNRGEKILYWKSRNCLSNSEMRLFSSDLFEFN